MRVLVACEESQVEYVSLFGNEDMKPIAVTYRSFPVDIQSGTYTVICCLC